MQFKALAIALSIVAVQSPAMAQDLEKNGLPCVSEICIGDGIAELSRIQWTPAFNPVKISNKAQPTSAHALNDDEMRMLKAVFPAAAEAAPFLHERQFDSSALPALAKITTACQTNELVGTYGSNGATPTKVRISLMPSLSDPTKQAWTVTNVVREFPTVATDAERATINKALNRKYAKFAAGKVSTDSGKAGEGYYSPSATTHFGFALSLSRATDEGNRMKSNPACGGA